MSSSRLYIESLFALHGVFKGRLSHLMRRAGFGLEHCCIDTREAGLDLGWWLL